MEKARLYVSPVSLAARLGNKGIRISRAGEKGEPLLTLSSRAWIRQSRPFQPLLLYFMNPLRLPFQLLRLFSRAPSLCLLVTKLRSPLRIGDLLDPREVILIAIG